MLVVLVARHSAALVGELGEVVACVVLQAVAAAVRRSFLYLVAEGVVLIARGVAQRVRDGNDVAVLVVGIADLAAVRVHGFGRALLRVEPDLAPVAVRVRGDGVVVEVGEIVLIHGAGSDLLLAPWCFFGCFARTQGTVPCVHTRVPYNHGKPAKRRETNAGKTNRLTIKTRLQWYVSSVLPDLPFLKFERIYFCIQIFPESDLLLYSL